MTMAEAVRVSWQCETGGEAPQFQHADGTMTKAGRAWQRGYDRKRGY